MKRLFLLLPAAVALPVIVAVSLPAIGQTQEGGTTGKREPAPQNIAPNPATPLQQGAPAAPEVPGHDHDHEGEEGEEEKTKDPVGDSLAYLWKQSDVAFHKGDFPTAIRIHRAIVTLDPADTESYGVGAWLLWSLNQKPEARAFIAQGLAANPKNPEMWATAGGQYDLEKSFSDAQNAYARAISLRGKEADEMLRRRLAHSAEHAGDLQLSEQTWTDLVRDFPASPVNKNNLARVKALRTKAPVAAPKKV